MTLEKRALFFLIVCFGSSAFSKTSAGPRPIDFVCTSTQGPKVTFKISKVYAGEDKLGSVDIEVKREGQSSVLFKQLRPSKPDFSLGNESPKDCVAYNEFLHTRGPRVVVCHQLLETDGSNYYYFYGYQGVYTWGGGRKMMNCSRVR